MAMTTRDPLGGLNLAEEFFRNPFGFGLTGALSNTAAPHDRFLRQMPIDVKESETGFEVSADIPGVSKEAIQVHVDGDILQVGVQKAEAKQENKEEGGVKYHRSERSTSFVSRALRMPDSADLDKVSAKYENGVLHLTVPKAEQKQKTKQITIG